MTIQQQQEDSILPGTEAPLVKNGAVLRLWLAERERAGLDGRDEMWNGVLHLVPPANGDHQALGSWLLENLAPAARQAGLRMTYETGVFAADDDYKVPDLVAASAAYISDRGVEAGAELVIEIRSPGDETMEKIPWYSEHGIGEVLVIDRDSLIVQHWVRPVSGELRPVVQEHAGDLGATLPGVRIQGVNGKLKLSLSGSSVRYPS